MSNRSVQIEGPDGTGRTSVARVEPSPSNSLRVTVAGFVPGTTQDVCIHDGACNALTSTVTGAKRSLDVGIQTPNGVNVVGQDNAPGAGFGIPAYAEIKGEHSYPNLIAGNDAALRVWPTGELLVRNRIMNLGIVDGVAKIASVESTNTSLEGSGVIGLFPMGIAETVGGLGSGTVHHLILSARAMLQVSNCLEDSLVPATPDLLAVAVERDDVLSTLTEANGDWGHLRMDSEGALWVRNKGDTVATDHLSASADGAPIAIAAIGSPGTLLHTAVTGTASIDRLYIDITNVGSTCETVTIEFGGTAVAQRIVYDIPAGATRRVVDGYVINNAKVVRAFAGVTNVLNAVGRRERLSA